MGGRIQDIPNAKDLNLESSLGSDDEENEDSDGSDHDSKVPERSSQKRKSGKNTNEAVQKNKIFSSKRKDRKCTSRIGNL